MSACNVQAKAAISFLDISASVSIPGLASGAHCVMHHLHRLTPGEHPVAGEGLWGTQREVPSFLYAMPVDGGRVFLEETCLVAKPPLPFSVLKRRLERRLGAMGLKVHFSAVVTLASALRLFYSHTIGPTK